MRKLQQTQQIKQTQHIKQTVLPVLMWTKCIKCGYLYRFEKMFYKNWRGRDTDDYICKSCASSKKDAAVIFNDIRRIALPSPHPRRKQPDQEPIYKVERFEKYDLPIRKPEPTIAPM